MAVYEYKAVRESGDTVAGTLDAESAPRARELLRHHGLYVTEMHPLRAAGRRHVLRRLLPFQRDRRSQVLWLTRELHLLLATGMPLREALASLARSAPRGMGLVCRTLRDDITKGESLAGALSRHPEWFDGLYASMVQVGERSGELSTVLGNLAQHLQQQGDFRRQMQTALLYPKLVALVAFAVVVFLMSAVVPRFITVISRRGGRLPLPTLILQHVSGFFAANWHWCLLGLLALWLAWRLLSTTTRFRLAWEAFLIRLPVVGPVRQKQAAQHFSVMLCVLLKGGVVLSRALRQLSETADNPLVAGEAERMHQRLRVGGGLTTTERGPIFPPSFSDMLAAGQESGALESVLETAAAAYSGDVEAATKKVAALVEPLAILMVAAVVAFVVAAVLLPVFELSQVQ